MEEAMSPRTLFLGRLIGLYCILAALFMFLRGQASVDTVILLLRDPPLMFVLGVVTLCAGLAMVLAHNAWSGGALAVIVTLVGWATLIKGLLFLILTPEAETALFLKALHYQELFRLYAAILLAVGVYLTHGGFKKSSRL
jgi:hypothetical protein